MFSRSGIKVPVSSGGSRICKRRGARSSAVGARIEAPKAPREVGEVFLPYRGGICGGAIPLP